MADPHTSYKSPLRYPGGKTRAIAILEKYVLQYYPHRNILISPFVGGGSFELYLEKKGYFIHANDLFRPLYVFWKVLQTNRNALLEKIRENMPVSKESFSYMKHEISNTTDEITMAALYYLINRTSFSGSTLCGGFSSQASTGRLNASSLETLQQCNLSNITFANMDCCTFLENNPQTSNTIVYCDPPYYIESYIYGKDGNMHENFQHEAFATAIQKRSDWIISYNDCEYIRNLYKDCRIFTESWSYGMNRTKKSSEIIILPKVA